MSTKFGQDFEVEVQARFEAGAWPVFLLLFCRGYFEILLNPWPVFLLVFCRGYFEILLNPGRDSEASFGQDFEA